MRSHAGLGPAEDCVATVEPVQRRAARPGGTLVTGKTIAIPEVSTPSTLHDIAADRGHIAQLSRGGQQQTFDHYRSATAHSRMCSHITHSRQGPDVQAPVGANIYRIHCG